MQNRASVVGPSLCDHRCSSVTTFVLLFCGNAEACKCPLYIPDADAGSELCPMPVPLALLIGEYPAAHGQLANVCLKRIALPCLHSRASRSPEGNPACKSFLTRLLLCSFAPSGKGNKSLCRHSLEPVGRLVVG
jgi:hypothetical protein